jgi:transposase InsO family protein
MVPLRAAEIVAHGLSQAFQKRCLPRSGLSDNGAAMTAAEVVEGLTRLGVLHETVLPYTPAANDKIETLSASAWTHAPCVRPKAIRHEMCVVFRVAKGGDAFGGNLRNTRNNFASPL